MTTEPSYGQILDEEDRKRHKRYRIYAVVGIVLVLLSAFFVQQRLQNKEKISYPSLVDTTRIVYVVNEPNPSRALRMVQRTMQTRSPRFSAIVYITNSPQAFPPQDGIDPEIKYLTAPDESTAVEQADAFAKNAQWTMPNRHLYYSFPVSEKLDTLLKAIMKRGTFTEHSVLALAQPPQKNPQ